MIAQFLQEQYESDLIQLLKEIYSSGKSISETDRKELKEYLTEDYALLGIIGLILQNKPRILLGRKQPFDTEIKELCEKVSITQNDLKEIADRYLDDNYSEEDEFILRKVMLEYPKQ